MRKIICMTVSIMFLVLLTASFASSQSLDGLWFKLNFTGKGFIRDTVTYEYFPSSFNEMAYMKLTWNPVNLWYDLELYHHYGGSWHYDTSHLEFPDGTEEFLPFAHMGAVDEDSNFWRLYFPTRIKIKKDQLGNVKSASLMDLGCLVDDSNYPANPTYEFYGTCKVRGKTLKKPPFSP